MLKVSSRFSARNLLRLKPRLNFELELSQISLPSRLSKERC